jgi:threonine/homoserine/homoserine lactone efflux protein
MFMNAVVVVVSLAILGAFTEPQHFLWLHILTSLGMLLFIVAVALVVRARSRRRGVPKAAEASSGVQVQ